MAAFVSTFTDIGLINTTTNAGTITLPLTSDIPYRQVIFKDAFGTLSNKPLTLSTQSGDTFEDGRTTRVLRDSFGFQTLYGYNGKWYFLGGTTQNAVTVSTISVSSINGQPFGGSGITSIPSTLSTSALFTSSVVASTIQSLSLSSGQLFVSSINGGTVILQSQVQSTVTGLGSTGYVSSLSLLSTTQGLQQSGFISSPNLLNLVSTQGLSTVLYSTINSLGSFGYLSTSQLTSSLTGLGSLGYISSAQLLSTSFGINSNISTSFSTLIKGIPTNFGGEVLYLNYSVTVNSYKQLGVTPTTAPLQTVPISVTGGTTSNLTGFQSDFQLPTFIPQGLWDFNIFALSSKAGTVLYCDVYTRTSGGTETLVASGSNDPVPIPTTSVTQLNTILVMPYTTLNAGDTVVVKVVGSNAPGSAATITTYYENGYYSHIHTTFGTLFPAGVLTSTVTGINNSLISTTRGADNQLISTTFGLTTYISSFVDPVELASTVIGLGTAGYVSSLALNSRITSTTAGLGTAGYVSSTQLASTTLGLQQSGFISSPNLLNLVSTQGLSTVLYSTINSLASFGYISTSQLTSTVAGLAASATIPANLSTLLLSSGIVTASSISVLNLSSGLFTASSINVITANVSTTATISSLTVNSLQFGDGTGWVNIGPLQTIAISSIQNNTNTLYANNSLFGNTSTQTALQFYGLFGNYNNTVLAEVSTGAGTQELLMFKGSSASDRIRMQTTGSIVFEPGVSTRLWSNNTVPTLSNATPAMIITTGSNVGIQTVTPATTLDVAGTGRFQQVSTLNINLSSINGQQFGAPINSTVIGLGSAGYISTLSLISTTTGLQQSGFVSSPNLLNLVSTQGLSTVLYSTINSLGSFGYISSLQLLSTTRGADNQLISTTAGLNLFISSFIDPTELASTVIGLGSAGFVSSLALDARLASTTTGLGSLGYVSSFSLQSTTLGLQQSGFVSSPNLLNLVSTQGLSTVLYSSIIALGSFGYVSTLSLISTTTGLQQSGFVSSPNLLNLVSTQGLSTVLYSSINALGSFGYISTSQLVSTVAGLGNVLTSLPSTISSFGLLTSSLVASTAQIAVLSTQQIFTSTILGNVSQFQQLSSLSLTVSSFYTATRQMTPMFVTF